MQQVKTLASAATVAAARAELDLSAPTATTSSPPVAAPAAASPAVPTPSDPGHAAAEHKLEAGLTCRDLTGGLSVMTADTTCASKGTTLKVNSAHLYPQSAVSSGESPESMQQVKTLASAATVAAARAELDLSAPTATTSSPPVAAPAAASPAVPTLSDLGHAAAEHGHDSPRGRQASRSRRKICRKGDRPSSSVRKSTPSARPAQAPRRGRRRTAPRNRSHCAAPNTSPHAVSVKRGGRPTPRREAARCIAEPLQSQWGLASRDAHACAKSLLREDIGLTCIFQLGLLSEAHISALTKGLSHIGGTIIKLAWEDLKNARFSFFPAAGSTFLNPIRSRTPDSPI